MAFGIRVTANVRPFRFSDGSSALSIYTAATPSCVRVAFAMVSLSVSEIKWPTDRMLDAADNLPSAQSPSPHTQLFFTSLRHPSTCPPFHLSGRTYKTQNMLRAAAFHLARHSVASGHLGTSIRKHDPNPNELNGNNCLFIASAINSVITWPLLGDVSLHMCALGCRSYFILCTLNREMCHSFGAHTHTWAEA